MRDGLPIIISAPSGTGKTTICNILRREIPDLKFAISHTTRPIRTGENDGVDYIFTTTDEFKSKIENNDFLEWAEVHEAAFYGTSTESINKTLKKGYDTIIELDIQGVKTLRKANYQGVYILILPPSIKAMEARLRKRGTEAEENIQRRLQSGKEEVRHFKAYDYVITNNIVEDTVKSIHSILLAEKARSSNYQSNSPDINTLLEDCID